MNREDQRLVEPGDENIRFALKWTEAMLRQRLSWASEAAVFVGEPRRTLDQNAKMWPMLADVARQVQWPVDGELRYLDPDDWKHMFSSALHKFERTAQGIDGGFVVLGQSTRRLTKRQFSDLIELIYNFGAEHNVVWSEPAKEVIAAHRKRRAA